MFKKAKLLMGLVFAVNMGTAMAAEPKIAVTDLTYEEKVSQYFRVVSAHSRSNVSARGSVRETDSSYSARGRYDAQQESSYHEAEGTYTYIDRGELRTYTADLKGELLKWGGVRLVQGRPYVGPATERIYDIIGRIKKGYYPGADYVLFGTVSNIAFRQETMPLAIGSSITATLTLDLVVDFSLINTRTYEVKSAFSATGTGQDTKILSRPGDRVVLNRGKVISETSKSLAENAYAELASQLGMPRPVRSSSGSQPTIAPEPKVEPVTVYK